MTLPAQGVTVRSSVVSKPLMIELVPLSTALAIACAITVLSIWDWTLYEKSRNEMRRYDQLVQHANEILSDLKDAETGQRGYLLTGKDSYLEPYRQSLSRIRSEYIAVERIATEADRVRLAALKWLVDQKLAELQQTIDMREQRGFAAALEVVQTDRGKRLIDQIRDRLAEIVDGGMHARQAAQERLRASAVSLRWVSVLGSLALVALVLVAQIGVRRANAKRLRLICDLQSSRDHVSAARDLFQTTLQSIGDAVLARPTPLFATDFAPRIFEASR